MLHHRIARLALAGALAASAAGCVSGGGPAPTDGEAADARAAVRVENRSLLDYTMYVVRSGVRTRIGQVGAGRTATLSIPPSIVQQGTPVSIVGDPIGGGSPVGQQFTLSRGDEVPMQIPPH
jgi:hypothetical protein